MSQTPPEPQAQGPQGQADPPLPPPPGYPQPPAYGQPVYPPPPGYAQLPLNSPPAYGQPVYPQPPAYGQPVYPPPYGMAYPAQQPMTQGQAPDSRNVLGILSLVAPFVGFSLVGVVLGHLGLSAVKKGRANNRGVALAGTIVSWVFTVFGVAGILAAIAIPIFLSQQDKAHEAAVRSDLRTLAIEASSYYVETGSLPEISFDGQAYHVADVVVTADATVTDAQLFSSGLSTYCIEVHYGEGLVRSIDDVGYLGYGCY